MVSRLLFFPSSQFAFVVEVAPPLALEFLLPYLTVLVSFVVVHFVLPEVYVL